MSNEESLPTDDDADWLDRDVEFDEDDTNESSSDLNLSEDQFSGLLVAPADWTIETLYNQIGKQIELDPEFQRRNVWSSKAKSNFIESLILGIPIPQILLSAKTKVKSSFLVLDGKQRLLAIKEFIDGKLPNGRTFKLRDLRVLKHLNGKSWSDIKTDPDLSNKLLNETQRTAVLRGWTNESVLYEIFFRLNSGSVKLSPMELRMSLYPGDFLKFIMRWTENIGPIHHLLKKRTPDPRMGDVELAVRFLGFQNGDVPYRGDLKDFLDKICEKYNGEFSDELTIAEIDEKLRNLNEAIITGIGEFGHSCFCRKYLDGKFESRFNRAIFDVMAYSLSNAELRAWATANPGALKSAFIEISQESRFVRSLETTTKSTESTYLRFNTWLAKCAEISGIAVALPAIG